MSEREKSAMYPSASWNDCLDFIKIIDSFRAKSVAYVAVAESYGLKSITTKSFTSKIGTAKQFGLITTGNSTIQLTDNANKILYPIDDTSVKKIALECFGQAPLYSRLIEIYNGKALPSVAVLANILMTSFKITKSAKDMAAKIFYENCEQLELIRAGVLEYNLANEIVIEDKKDVLLSSPLCSEEVIQKELPIKQEYESKEDTLDKNEYIIQKYPVDSGKVAQIIIPIDSTEDDLWAIRDMFDVIMKRKFKIELN
ncbi:hypothetical protein [Konateibacter massiliensis]|uniref:hypothetical protein n=1 Tax=Konateibacter massiliensis TaxID=2002841 RepID=UPI000C15EE99|nr:hypothetical protein [Konateibacter massiliensis]